MCPGMRPATGWMAYFTSPPLLLDQFRQLAHLVLRLRHRHAVARNDDHAARVGELHGRVLRARSGAPSSPAAVLAVVAGCARRRRRRARCRTSGSSPCSSAWRGGSPEAPSSAPAMISTLLPMAKPVADGGQAGVGVQQRDHHRHVRAADGQHHQHADQQAPRAIIA